MYYFNYTKKFHHVKKKVGFNHKLRLIISPQRTLDTPLCFASKNYLPTLDAEHYKRRLSKCKEIHILVKMYRRRGRGTAISLYDPLPPLPQKPKPVYKNIVAMAIKVSEYLESNTQRTYTSAGNHFGVTRARISQLMTILEKLPADLISSLKTTQDQALIKRFSGKTLLRIACLSTPEQRQSYIETVRNRIS